jgi:hypothetical protein
MAKGNGRTAQPKKGAGNSWAETEIYISEDEEFYMKVEPHWHASQIGKKLDLESVHININAENVDLTVSLPIKAFVKLVMMGLHYKESKQPIVARPDGSFRVGEIGAEQKVSRDNFIEEAVRGFLSPANPA